MRAPATAPARSVLRDVAVCCLIALGLPCTAWADIVDVVEVCRPRIIDPDDGATAVPLDVVITGSSTCGAEGLLFHDDTGQVVPADVTSGSWGFVVVPQTPLEAGRSYRVGFPDTPGCGVPSRTVTFSTAPDPAVHGVDIDYGGGEIQAVVVDLTEPVVDLGEQATRVAVSIDDFPLAPTIEPGIRDDSFAARFEKLPQRPAYGGTIRITLRRGLRFASGVALPEDLVLVLDVKRDMPFGEWTSTGGPDECDRGELTGGCAATPATPAAAAWPWLTGIGLATVAMWRRRAARRACA